MDILSIDFLNSVGVFISESPLLGYFLLALAFVLRGEAVLFISIYLLTKGFLSWFVVIPLIFVTMAVNDHALYLLGRMAHGTKLNGYLEKEYVFPGKLKKYFMRKFFRLMFLVKFTIGLSTITMFLSGWSRINYKRFAKTHFLSSLFWLLTMTLLGSALISGIGYLQLKELLDGAEFVLFGVIIAILGFEYLIQRFLRKESGIEDYKPIRTLVKEKKKETAKQKT